MARPETSQKLTTGWHALSLRRAWAVRVDLASFDLMQDPTKVSCLEQAIDLLAKVSYWVVPALRTWFHHGESVLASPRPTKTQGVPPATLPRATGVPPGIVDRVTYLGMSPKPGTIFVAHLPRSSRSVSVVLI